MQNFSDRLRSVSRCAFGLGVGVLAMASCGREPSAPAADAAVRFSRALEWKPLFPPAYQVFQASGNAAVVEFTKVRIVLNNPDGSIAIDTVVNFPAGATEVQLTLSVPLPASAPASGQPLALNLDYQNAAGQTVFHGGPVMVNAVPKTPGGGPPPAAPITIPISYTGPGANATAVRITPKSIVVHTGGVFSVSAVAVDAGGTPVPNTPIVFVSKNQLLAAVNASTGQGTAGSTRGATEIEAQLLTGPTDVASLTILSPPASIAEVSGSSQSAPVKSTLPKPVVVKVLAVDGLGAPGVPVSFATPSGGTVGSATVNTDADGNAQTTWTLGSSVGSQTLTATVDGLAGSPVTFTATGRSIDPVRLVVTVQPPASTAAGSPLAPAIVISALDGSGTVTSAFTGPVTLALTAGAPTGARLAGPVAVNAVAGAATFGGLSLNKPGTYSLEASAGSLTGTATASFEIVPGPARKLVFQSYPIIGGVAGAPLDAVTVVARDDLGNTATFFTGSVTLSLAAAAAAVRVEFGQLAIDETKSVNAVAGSATFNGVSLFTVGGYAFNASADGLQGATGPVFGITAGPARSLDVVSGGGQTGAASAALPSPVVVRIADAFGNPIGGITVNFAAGGGSVSPASAVTGSDGRAMTSWTLGGSTGVQALNVTSAGLETLIVKATAESEGGGGSGGELIVINDGNWGDNNWGLSKSGAAFVYPGNEQFVKNLLSFSPSGPRGAATKVLTLDDGSSYFNVFSVWSNFTSIVTGLGYVMERTTSHSAMNTIASDIKLVILMTPRTAFSAAEINGLKAFASQGGRILFVGENSGFYSNGFALEAAFLSGMGSAMTITPGCFAPGEILNSVSHPLTAGIAASGAGGFYMNCTSRINPGAGDVTLMTDGSNRVMVAIAKVSFTPIVAGALRLTPNSQPAKPVTPANTDPRATTGAAATPPPKARPPQRH